MKLEMVSKFLKTSLIFSIVLSISSCGSNANIAKVRQFALLAKSAEEELPKIANDVHLSCLREARYRAVSISAPLADPKNSVLKQALLRNSLINSNNEKDIGDRLEQRTDAQKKCDEITRKLGPMMRQGNGIVVAYIKRLGELASGERINLDPEFDELKVNAEELSSKLSNGSFKPEQVTAGIGILNFLVTGILNDKILNTFSEVISSVDRPFQTYCQGLATVVERVYINTYLSNEETALDNYYKDYIRDILTIKTTEAPSGLSLVEPLLSLDDRWNAEKDKLQNKRDLAYSYIELLRGITAIHHELAQMYIKGDKPDNQEANKMLEKTTKSLNDFVDKAHKLP